MEILDLWYHSTLLDYPISKTTCPPMILHPNILLQEYQQRMEFQTACLEEALLSLFEANSSRNIKTRKTFQRTYINTHIMPYHIII